MNVDPHKIVLNDLRSLVVKIQSKAFIKKNDILSGATIGEHFRHIIEFYQCCLEQSKNITVNYDLRERNKQLECDQSKGIIAIDTLLNSLSKLEGSNDVNLILKSSEDHEKGVKTTFFRELIYCMDHGIHHQSLIKIALIDQGLNHLINDKFGVAFSTQNYRNQCAS